MRRRVHSVEQPEARLSVESVWKDGTDEALQRCPPHAEGTASMSGNDGDRHLSEAVIAAYLDGGLDAEEAHQVRLHLDACDECRAEIVDVQATLEHLSRRSRRRIPTLVAAAVAGLLLIGGPIILSSDQEPTLRGPDGAATLTNELIITTISPGAGEVVPFGELRLSWRSTNSGALYVVTLTDEGGDPLWTTETRDTLVSVPASVVLEPGGTVLWYVDALLADGRSATSGVQGFQTGR